MKKPKIKLDADKIKSFCVHHCEKIVLAVVVLLVAFFVYRGYQLQGLEAARTPDKLRQEAQNTVSFIQQPDHWTELSQERQVKMNVPALVQRGQLPSDPGLYRLPIPWNKQDFPKLVARTDPKIYPPVHLHVVEAVGPLAYFATETDVDPLPATLASESLTPAKPPRPKRTRQPRGGAEGGAEVFPGAEGMPQPRSARGRRRPAAEAAAPEMAMPGMEGAFGPQGEMGMGGSSAGLNPESLMYGFKTDGTSAIAKVARINVVTAVVPYEKQIEEFDRALASSLDYDAIRDRPRTLLYRVERADVTATPNETDPDKLTWDRLSVKGALLETEKWAGYPEEVLDPNYLDYTPELGREILTHPAPPFLQRDLWPLLVHPEVPLASLAGQTLGPAGLPGQTPAPGAKEAPGDLPADLPSDLSQQIGPGMGMGMEGGYQPGMAGMGMEGGGGGRGARPQPTRSQPGMGMGEMGMGMGMNPGMEGMGGPTVIIPKYKLIRFNDMHVVPGRMYRYKISVLLEDPNHPSVKFQPPSVQSLSDEVRTRLKTVETEEVKLKQRKYWVQSPWSEMSRVATLPATDSFYAGKAIQPSASKIVDGKPPVPNKEPAATVLTVVLDERKAADIPAEKEVQRGSVLNFTADVEVIHPVLTVVRKLEKYAFHTDAVVADILGGETIPPLLRGKEQTLQAPGEVLIFDAQGNLHVRNETDDIESFRRYLVPKVEAASMPAQDGMDALGDPMAEGEMDALGGPRGRRRGAP